jgi:hypothetical protein
MSQVPLNQRLWNSLVVMAKAKFKKWPSLPASKWVHEQYVQKGGKFASAGEVAAAKKHHEALKKKSSEKRTETSRGKKGEK